MLRTGLYFFAHVYTYWQMKSHQLKKNITSRRLTGGIFMKATKKQKSSAGFRIESKPFRVVPTSSHVNLAFSSD